MKLSEAIEIARVATDLDKLTSLSKACITHILLSGTGGEELTIIGREIDSFITLDLSDRLGMLRYKATLERGIRLA